ncbi:MAG TPA: hypothetical protein VJ256_03825 [Dehalococcoidia bacterium]|nr:hypothetical protein [Dehalococcoidia bacterium]
MAPGPDGPEAAPLRRETGPRCRRCDSTVWQVESRRKNRLRFWFERLLAAPEVLLFGDESPGWPSPEAEFWTCLSCGRRVRV